MPKNKSKTQRKSTTRPSGAGKSTKKTHPSCVDTVTNVLGKRIRYQVTDTMPDPMICSSMCANKEAFQLRGSWEEEYSDKPRGPQLSVTQIRDKEHDLLRSYFEQVQSKLPKECDSTGAGFELARKWSSAFALRYGVHDPCTSLMGFPEDAGAEYEEAIKKIGKPFLVYGCEPGFTRAGKRAIFFHLGVGIGVEELDVNFGIINHEWYYESAGSIPGSCCDDCTLVGLYPTEAEAEAALAKAEAADECGVLGASK